VTRTIRRTLLRALGLILLGALAGVLNNLAAGPARRVAWIEDYPPKGEPLCRQHGEGAGAPAGGAAGTGPARPGDGRTAAGGPGLPDLSNVPMPEFRPDLPYVQIDGLQALRLHKEGALFVDARRTDAYLAGHIEGAFSVPVWESGVEEKIAALPFTEEKAPVVAYCSGGDCEDSHLLAGKLWEAGWLNALVYTAGYPEWADHGWPTHEGMEP